MSNTPPEEGASTRPKKIGPKDTELPFYEGKQIGDEQRWSPRRWGPPVLILLGVAFVALLFVVLWGSGDDDEPADGDDEPVPVATTSTTTTSTTAPEATTTTADSGLQPGEECTPDESLPDCVDLNDDGVYTYIVGAAECLESGEQPINCRDNDGDGDAGPPVNET